MDEPKVLGPVEIDETCIFKIKYSYTRGTANVCTFDGFERSVSDSECLNCKNQKKKI